MTTKLNFFAVAAVAAALASAAISPVEAQTVTTNGVSTTTTANGTTVQQQTNSVVDAITNSTTGSVLLFTNSYVITVSVTPPSASVTVTGDSNAPSIETGFNMILKGLTGQSTNWYGAAYGLYAPKLEHKVGGGFGVFTPIGSPYTVAGARIDYVDGGFWMPEGTFTLQAPLHPFTWFSSSSWASNIVVTPFANAGIGLPLSGAKIVTQVGSFNVPGKIQDNNGQATAITGEGVVVTVWHRKNPTTIWCQPTSLGVAGDIEQWSGFPGNQYRVGVEGHWLW